MEIVAGEQGEISFFNARDLKLCHFAIFDMLFPFLAFFKL